MAGQTRLLISGASGLIGAGLRARLGEGYSITRLVRRAAGPEEVRWDPGRPLDPATISGFDAVVHLAGENVASGYWTAARMARIHDSRVVGTRHLSDALATAEQKPAVMVAASAIGFYGDRGEEWLDEHSPPGSGFLARTGVEWERATEPAAAAGIRVVNLRIGVVLSSKGGALPKMITPFRLGLGAKLGSGRQWMSWIALPDLLRVIESCLIDSSMSGPVNAVAPEPVTNSDFAETLGRLLHRPVLFRAPAWVLRLVAGKMADEALLTSQRVKPAKLEQTSFRWEYPEFEQALKAVLQGGF